MSFDVSIRCAQVTERGARRATFAAVFLFLGTILTAQQGAPGVCFSFNPSSAAATSSLPVVAGGELYIGFSPPQAATIERIDVFLTAAAAATLTLEVCPTNGSVVGPSLGSASVLIPGPNWNPFVLGAPVVLSAGSAYALRFTLTSGPSNVARIGGDGAGGSQLGYALWCGQNPPSMSPACSSYATAGQFAARLLFRAAGCGPSPLAYSSIIGTSCATTGASACSMNVTAPPIIGSSSSFQLFGGPGTFNIYFGTGLATAGLDLGLGYGCSLYIDPVALQYFYLGGLEPIATLPATVFQRVPGGPVVPTPAYFPFTVPQDPLLVGFVVTVQTLVSGVPGGIPTPGGGVQITNAVELHLGL